MKIISLILVLKILVVSSLALAQTGTVETEEQKKKKILKKTTQVSFEDVLVQGKYHFSDEAVTTVEQDKVLDALLGVRADFQDRINNSAEQY